MKKFLIAIIFFPMSFLIIYYRARIKDLTGDIDFAEKYLGSGGTYTFIIIVGVFVFVATLMYLTGTLQNLLGSTLGKIF